MKQDRIEEIRDKMVVKANDLIQKSRYDLSLLQHKIVLYLIAQITPKDKEFQIYEFSIMEFCRVVGIDTDSGKNYSDVKKAIKDIADKSMWIELDNGDETLVRFIEKPYINKQSGLIRIKLDEDLKPYLLELKKNFTQYELLWTLHFKSKYTIRLYELIKSIHYKELEEYQREFSVEDLRRLLDAQKYTEYKNFRARVIDPSVREINAYSDKIVSYEPIKTGKTITSIVFTIATKNTMDVIKLRSDIEHEFGLDQMTLWDVLEEKGLVSND